MIARKKKCDGSLPTCARRSLTYNYPNAPGGPLGFGGAAVSASAESSELVSAGPSLAPVSTWAPGYNIHQVERERGVKPAADLSYFDGPTALDGQSSPMLLPAPCPSRKAIEASSTHAYLMPSHEFHRAELPSWNSPKTDTSHVDICPSIGHTCPQSSALAHANLILPPCESVSTPDPADMATTGCAPLRTHESQGLHRLPFPPPPPEVTALLTARSLGDVVSPVFARNSPLVPWELASEIGHFWLGLFKISEVKVTRPCYIVRHLISLCRFRLFSR